MPDLTNTVRWVEYPPDLLGNLDAERPFYFLLNGSMSKEQMRAMKDALARECGPDPLPELAEDATEEQKAAHKDATEKWLEEVRQAVIARDAAALEPFIRFGDEPLTNEGKRITTLREYFELVTSPRLVGMGAFLEVRRALGAANTMEPRVSFSSGRSSGGGTSTGRKRTGGQTVAR